MKLPSPGSTGMAMPKGARLMQFQVVTACPAGADIPTAEIEAQKPVYWVWAGRTNQPCECGSDAYELYDGKRISEDILAVPRMVGRVVLCASQGRFIE